MRSVRSPGPGKSSAKASDHVIILGRLHVGIDRSRSGHHLALPNIERAQDNKTRKTHRTWSPSGSRNTKQSIMPRNTYGARIMASRSRTKMESILRSRVRGIEAKDRCI